MAGNPSDDSVSFPEWTNQYQPLLVGMAFKLLRGRRNLTVTPKMLVQAALLRILAWARKNHIQMTEKHLYFAAAKAMEQIVKDEARKKKTQVHGDGYEIGELTHDPEDKAKERMTVDEYIDIQRALDELEQVNERAADAVRLVRIIGYTQEEAAEILGVSSRAVQRSLRLTDAWMASRASRLQGMER
jgi:RNA polymerase sigma factor (TIGR02999 family)